MFAAHYCPDGHESASSAELSGSSSAVRWQRFANSLATYDNFLARQDNATQSLPYAADGRSPAKSFSETMTFVAALTADCPVLAGGNLVLVVDDDRAVLQALKRVLRQHGFDTILFPSADAFRKHSDFDEVICVILDLDLEDGSSIPLRRKLKANGNSVPVIYITGNDSETVRKAALQSGCIDYLVKPFPAKSLIESVKLAGAWPI